jgi:hypothetical protein
MDDKKNKRIQEVEYFIQEFSDKYLDDELKGYAFKLWQQLGKKQTYNVTGGKKEIWAAAVIYVIGRLNFLFDKSNSNHLTADTICDFFGTSKNTVSGRATEIEKVCKIRQGHKGLCRPDISDSLTFIQLPNGIVLTKKIAKEMGFFVP